MKKFIVICIFHIHGIFGRISFLQIPKSLIQLQNETENELDPTVSIADYLEEEEEDEDVDVNQVLSTNELRDLRGIISNLDRYEIHDRFYDPSSNVTHRSKRGTAKDLITNLNDMVANLEKLEETTKPALKKQYFSAAIDLLDDYIKAVKSYRHRGEQNALQIFKLEQYNLVLVNCGGWLWFPVQKIKKVLSCQNGILRFEKRGSQNVQVCDDFYCKQTKL